ncbi:hypothetical protein MKW98_015961 [Papaver atlanticum]|uniref:Uncharacterized protein n=1 Tax=Papaver atlanticum TaxID=357466 RepID=A0AAD4X382_9MAGN|nr:hypothetical protein MKW98_015961 [Papaver atlanticum]
MALILQQFIHLLTGLSVQLKLERLVSGSFHPWGGNSVQFSLVNFALLVAAEDWEIIIDQEGCWLYFPKCFSFVL